MRDRLCFLCLRKGHRASECERTTITVANVIDGIINRFVKWRKQNKSKTRCHVRFNRKIHQIRKIYQRMENTATLSVANFRTRSTVVLQTLIYSASTRSQIFESRTTSYFVRVATSAKIYPRPTLGSKLAASLGR